MGARLAGGLTAVLLAVWNPAPAWYATEWTQLGNVAVNTDAWRESVQTQINTYRQLQDMIRQAEHWADTLAEQPEAVLDQVAGQTHQGMAISYALGNMDARFREVYKTYDAFTHQNYGRRAFSEDYKKWSQTTSDSIENALKASGVQMDSLADEVNILQQLRQRLATSGESRNKAIQVAGDINTMNVVQLQKLRQLLATNMQIQTAWVNEQNAERKVTQAKRERYFDPDAELPIIGNSEPVTVPKPSVP